MDDIISSIEHILQHVQHSAFQEPPPHSVLGGGQRTLLYLGLSDWPHGLVHGHGARPNPPEGLQNIEGVLPFVTLRVVALHNVHHAAAVPRVAPDHVDAALEHGHTDVALPPWHGRHHCPLVGGWAVVLAPQHVVVVIGATEVVAAHHVEAVAQRTHAVKPTQLHHVCPPAPEVTVGVVTPHLLLEGVLCDAP